MGRSALIAAMAAAWIVMALARPGGPAHSAAVQSAGADSVAGAPPPPRSIQESPGWRPPADPESASVRIGRRVNAPLVSMPFEGGPRSIEELGRAVCWAAHHEHRDTLARLAVSQREFETILWPEFPQSRPATGLTADFAWELQDVRIRSGISRFLSTYGGEPLTFVRFDRADTVMRFRNFKVHNRLTMIVRGADGVERPVDFIRAIAERKGRFKIQSTSD